MRKFTRLPGPPTRTHSTTRLAHHGQKVRRNPTRKSGRTSADTVAPSAATPSSASTLLVRSCVNLKREARPLRPRKIRMSLPAPVFLGYRAGELANWPPLLTDDVWFF